MVKYSRRLPVNRTKHMNKTFAMLSNNDIRATAWSASIGLSYALKICTMNGRIENVPENWASKNNTKIIVNGLMVRRRFNSPNFSSTVGDGCEHGRFCFSQNVHDFERTLCSCSSWNSADTVCDEAQPRSQHNDFSASFTRFFDSNHWGVSGILNYIIDGVQSENTRKMVNKGRKATLTKNTANADITGSAEHTIHTERHGINVFNTNVVNIPIVAQINVKPIKTPRVDGSLQIDLNVEGWEREMKQKTNNFIFLIKNYKKIHKFYRWGLKNVQKVDKKATNFNVFIGSNQIGEANQSSNPKFSKNWTKFTPETPKKQAIWWYFSFNSEV